MPNRKVLTRMARARIPEKLYLKLMVYADKHCCHDSDVVREALKKFLRNVSTKHLQNDARAVNAAQVGA